MIWNQEGKFCSLIEFSCLLDMNMYRKVNEKLKNCGPLVTNLQVKYPEYKFQVAPIVIYTMGYVLKCLISYLKMIGFNENGLKVLIPKLEIKSISGTVKICDFLKFNDPFTDFSFN